MSILIKNMEIPKACYECRMYEADIYYCAAAERDIDIPSLDEGRCSFCPLVPIPPHGRLIDADGEIGVNVTMMPGGKCKVDLIASTIIPAEEDGEEA